MISCGIEKRQSPENDESYWKTIAGSKEKEETLRLVLNSDLDLFKPGEHSWPQTLKSYSVER